MSSVQSTNQPTKPVVLSEKFTYGVRLVSILAKTCEVLRDKFHKQFPTDPAQLYKEIKKHDKKLKSLLGQKVIHKTEYNILLPATGLTDSSKFDLSLLILLLIALNVIRAPVTGWKTRPMPSDVSEGANLLRIRFNRNEIMHSYFKYDEKSFTNIWDRIVSALEGFGCDQKELLALKSAPPDPSSQAIYEKQIQDLKQAYELIADQKEHIADQKEHIADQKQHIANLGDSLQGVTYNLFPSISSFTGREKEINEIHQNFTATDKKHIAMVIYGLGGVGKSELAREYCNIFAESYYQRNVIWINAEDKHTMTEEFLHVAERIPLNTSDGTGKTLSIKTIINKVYRFFADRPALFVFDNAMNKTDLLEFMGTNASSNLSVLITSQFSEWSARFIQSRVEVLSKEDAFTLVSQNLDKKYILHDDNKKALCDKMQYLPLALQQSIAYMNRLSITIDKYLEKFQSCADKILRTYNSDEKYNKTVMTTWNMALHKLEDEENLTLAITLINYMSYFDGKNIKKELFYEYYDEHLVNESLQLLEKYSLIVKSTSNDDLEQTILMHSLLQYVIRTQSEHEYLAQFLDLILNPLNKGCDIEHESYGTYWYYQLAHMFHQKIYSQILAPKIYKNLKEISTIFFSKGKFSMLYHILILLENFQVNKFGYKSQTSINIKQRIGSCLLKMGNCEEALIKYREVEKLQIETIGSKHPSTLTTQHNIAQCLLEMGNYEEALTIYQEVEKLQIKTMGNKHPNTLTNQHNIAQCFLEMGNYEKALIKYREVEQIQVKTIGKIHLSTLITQGNIAQCLLQMGNYDEALMKYREKEKMQIETIGREHPSTLINQHDIAQCLLAMGNADEALIKYREVEKMQIESIGRKHPSTLINQHDIAQCLLGMGNNDEALIKYREVEILQIETIGRKHPSTLMNQHDIAQCLLGMGNANEALIKYREVEKMQIETLGCKHPSTLINQHDIAQCLLGMGNADEALIKYREVEKMQIETIGCKHPSTLINQHDIAQCLLGMGNADEALIKYREVEKMQIETIGCKHPSTLINQQDIAQCLLAMGNADKALIKYREVEKTQIETIGRKHPSTLINQHDIAQCLLGMGDADAALIIYREVEKMQIETIGSKHQSTLINQHDIAQCLLGMGNANEALIIYREVEKMQIETIGRKHPSTLTNQYDIAQCLQQMGNYEEALIKYREVVKLQIETVGNKHPSTIATEHKITQCLQDKGNSPQDSIKY